MPIDARFKVTGGSGLKRDVRPWTVRTAAWLKNPDSFLIVNCVLALFLLMPAPRSASVTLPDFSIFWPFTDLIFLAAFFYFRWFRKQTIDLPFKLPMHATKLRDKNNPDPGKSGPGKPEGILFLGNVRDGSSKDDEVWITNSDARTHILFLGTTGAGKSEGLKSFVSNAMCWSSGFVYVDGKAQNTLWGDVYSLARRFGRDDDVLVLNYLTGNSDNSSRSNSLNPFSIGSASYLTQMMVGLMDDAGGDNAMWKGRAISLMSALLPALTWKREHQGLLLDVGVIRDNLTMQQMIKMSRDPALPDRIIRGLQSYLDTLPGYVDTAFDNEGNEKPPTQDQPMVDLSQTRQQHGYLTMQFTRSLSSLADEYGYIFKQQMADIDMMDVVLNRRILVVLIPALEKSPDEAANLGKIVVAALKGMMGATLGSELEGEQSSIIDNNPTTASTPFITVFDEVGYYTSPGMGVMAAQARSLGFCLIFAGQDMPALQMRVKEEALSITGNCNLKIFGKLEDPTETKDFFEKTVSSALVSEVSGFSSQAGMAGGKSYYEGDNITFQAKKEAGYDDLKRQGQGQVHLLFAEKVVSANLFYANPKRVNVVRVQRLLGVSQHNWSVEARDKATKEVLEHLRDPNWRAGNGAPAGEVPDIVTLISGQERGKKAGEKPELCAAIAVGALLAQAKRNATEAVSAPGLAAGGQWPLGAPPSAGGAPQAGSTTPPWLGGAAAPAAPAGTPPPFMQAGAAGGAQPPPFMQGAPAAPATMPPYGAPTGAPPPWAGGAMPAHLPNQPPAQPPLGAGQPLPPWAGGGSAGAGAGAAGQRPPPGVFTPPAGQPPYGAPPYAAPPAGQPPYGQSSYGQPPYGQPPAAPYAARPPAPPPYAPPPTYAVPPAAPPPYGHPPYAGGVAAASAPPPWAAASPVRPPAGPPVGPPVGMPPAGQSPLYGTPPAQTPPPWAGAGIPAGQAQGVAPPYTPPHYTQPYAAPYAQPYPPAQPAAPPPYPVGGYPPQTYPPVAVPAAVPPAAFSAGPPAILPPTTTPAPLPPAPPAAPDAEVDDILKQAAGNLSDAMFTSANTAADESKKS